MTNLLHNFLTPELFTPNTMLANIPNIFASLSTYFKKKDKQQQQQQQQKIHIVLFHETRKTLIHLFLLDIFTHKLFEKDNSLLKLASLQAYFTPPYLYI